jgi:hypothetical protein
MFIFEICASLRAAKMLAAINSTRLRPSSTAASLQCSLCVRHERFWTKKSHLWSTPVAFPFCRTYGVLRQSSAACKALNVLKTTVLKRLASAVQLRPWPPCFQSLSAAQNPKPVPFCSNSNPSRVGVCLKTNRFAPPRTAHPGSMSV